MSSFPVYQTFTVQRTLVQEAVKEDELEEDSKKGPPLQERTGFIKTFPLAPSGRLLASTDSTATIHFSMVVEGLATTGGHDQLTVAAGHPPPVLNPSGASSAAAGVATPGVSIATTVAIPTTISPGSITTPTLGG